MNWAWVHQSNPSLDVCSVHPCFSLFCHCVFTVLCGLTIDFEKKAVNPTRACCVCADRRPPGPGACLPHGGRGRRLQCPANAHHARHRLPLLLFQLPLRPQPAATATQTGVCRSHEPQSCSSANEGVYFTVYAVDFESPLGAGGTIDPLALCSALPTLSPPLAITPVCHTNTTEMLLHRQTTIGRGSLSPV